MNGANLDNKGYIFQDNNLLTGDTVVKHYLDWLKDTVDSQSDFYDYIKGFMENAAKKECTNTKQPFLSIITRTQGKRLAMLTETFLCLTAQSNTNFELIVIGHNLNEQQHDCVIGLINDLPEWLFEQTRYIPVNGGTRTTPLNVGFSESRGEYIAVLDDDDIVFDNWVEEFFKCAKENAGTILHAYVILQNWLTVDDENGIETPRCADTPRNDYCKKFDLINELVVNSCPLIGLAFPSYVFHELGFRFDETLTTTEDWDFFMRTAFLTGVSDIKVPTSIYRLWINSENSQTVHDKNEWENNYRRIHEKFKTFPIIFLQENVSKMIKFIEQESRFPGYSDVDCSEASLYYDNGRGYSESRILFAKQCSCMEWIMEFDEFADLGVIKKLRFDPVKNGGIQIDKFRVEITHLDGKVQLLSLNNVATNGYRFKNSVIFLKSDPQIRIKIKNASELSKVRVYFENTKYLSDEVLDVIMSPGSNSMKKIYNLLARIYRRIFQ